MQPEKIDSNPVAESPVDPLPVVIAKPEPAIDAIEEEIPPDLGTPLTVCVDEAPRLVASGVLPDDLRQLPAADTLPKPTATAEPPE